jgi:hypothetical protein
LSEIVDAREPAQRAGIPLVPNPNPETLPALAAPASSEKGRAVMLSAAKHLECLLENKPIHILRFAQDERVGAFFSIL